MGWWFAQSGVTPHHGRVPRVREPGPSALGHLGAFWDAGGVAVSEETAPSDSRLLHLVPAVEDEAQRGSRELTPGPTRPACSPGVCRACVWPRAASSRVWGLCPRHGQGSPVPGPICVPPRPALASQLFPCRSSRLLRSGRVPTAPVGPAFHPPGGLVYHRPLPPPHQPPWSPAGQGRTRWPVPVWATADGPVLNIRARAPGEPHTHTFKEQKMPPESPSG